MTAIDESPTRQKPAFAPARIRRSAAALCLSVVAVGGIVVVQGRFVFHRELATALAPDPIRTRRFLPDREGRCALAILESGSSNNALITPVAGFFDLQTDPPAWHPLELPSSPWYAVASAGSGAAFVGTENGDLFWLDKISPGAGRPIYFGTHPEVHPSLLQCPDDGSLVVVAGNHMSAWDPRAAALLWRSSDLLVASCAFVPRSRRLICGLESGDILELDPRTGDRLRLIACHPTWAQWLTISPDGSRLASVNGNGNCFLTDLESGETVWTRRFWPTAGPQFSSDGQSLLIPTAAVEERIAVVSTAIGESIGKLHGGGLIVGLRVAMDGNAYAWNTQGMVTAWNLATGKIVLRLDPSAIHGTVLPVQPIDNGLPQVTAPPRSDVTL